MNTGENTTLGELTELWLGESLGVISPGTLSHYGGLMHQYVLPWFGDGLDIPEEKVTQYIDEMKARGLAESSIFTQLRLLHRVLEYGASLGLCDAPGWDSGRGTPRRKQSLVILSPEEEAQLTKYLIDNPGGKNLCLFLMLSAGLQIGEVLALQWKDVSVKLGSISVKTERGPVTGRIRTVRKVPIGERQKIYLRRLAGEPEHYLASGTAKPMGRATLEAHLRRILDQQVLPPIAPTVLRHTYAVRAIEGGMSYETLSRQMGVANGSNFRRMYGALVSEDDRQRLERERRQSRKVRRAPEHISPPRQDPEITALQRKIEARKKALRSELDSLDGDLAIIRTLRNSDCVQGACRQGLYAFIEKVLAGDKDGRYLVEYLRCNMRVADMPLLDETTPQAIRRRVAHGLEKLSARLDELYAEQGGKAGQS